MHDGSFKEGTYKGLDITFGDQSYGGCLIDPQDLSKTLKVIEGPCLVVKLTSAKDLDDLITTSDIFKCSQFHLKEVTFSKEMIKEINDFSKSPRVGLKLNSRGFDQRCQYLLKPYRVIVGDHQCKKQRITISLMNWYNGLDASLTQDGYHNLTKYIDSVGKL